MFKLLKPVFFTLFIFYSKMKTNDHPKAKSCAVYIHLLLLKKARKFEMKFENILITAGT